WNGEAAHAALRKVLDDTSLNTRKRLRALWALQVTGGLGRSSLFGLLDVANEYVRAWAVQLLFETPPPAGFAAILSRLAGTDPSRVVRSAFASALQGLRLDQRWEIAEGLLSHADGADPNLPLMTWYGVEPLVYENPGRAVGLAARAKIPHVRELIA